MKDKKKKQVAIHSLIVVGCIVLLVFVNINRIKKVFLYSSLRAQYAKFLTADNISKGLISQDSILFCEFELSHDLDRGGVWSDDQDVTHPSVIKKGDTTWIALTPYPQALELKGETYENACVFYSTEKYPATRFHTIKRNPVIYKDSATYNSDCDLFYDNTDSQFYLVNRKRGLSSGVLTQIVMQNSLDGHIWSEPIVLFETDRPTLCPCLVKTNGGYQIIAFNAKDQATLCESIEIWESTSLQKPRFQLKGIYPWNNKEVSIWHGDVVFENNKYYMTSCGINTTYKTRFGDNDHYKYLWYGKSDDGINWAFNSVPIIQANGVYRSTMFFDDDEVIFYVSFHQRFFDKQHRAGNKIGCVKVTRELLDQ